MSSVTCNDNLYHPSLLSPTNQLLTPTFTISPLLTAPRPYPPLPTPPLSTLSLDSTVLSASVWIFSKTGTGNKEANYYGDRIKWRFWGINFTFKYTHCVTSILHTLFQSKNHPGMPPFYFAPIIIVYFYLYYGCFEQSLFFTVLFEYSELGKEILPFSLYRI